MFVFRKDPLDYLKLIKTVIQKREGRARLQEEHKEDFRQVCAWRGGKDNQYRVSRSPQVTEKAYLSQETRKEGFKYHRGLS